METIYIYPGRFSPPTKGHFEIVKQAARALPRVYIVNSTNPKKEDIFSTEESRNLWNTYDLPENVEVVTFKEFMAFGFDRRSLVIIRGLRDYKDLADEKIVMELNKKEYGIDKYMYFLSTCGFEGISASKVRELATNMEIDKLHKYVSPLVITSLIEKMYGLRNLFLVVGRPGSGKTTFLEKLAESRDDVVHINTDLFNRELRPILIEAFGEADLIDIAVNHEKELRTVIAKPWIELLKKTIKEASLGSNVFIEIAYGLEADKEMYKYVGGKILYVGCDNTETNIQRVKERQTEKLIPFVEKIPDWEASVKIAKKKMLSIKKIDTGGSLDKLAETVRSFAEKLN